ncbi:MAG: class I SAM-dependent methyltransferase [Rhodobacter sp.]|nr:class I SAM-dependent methyltransferase [Rhodobacter sp.]
MSQDDQTIGVYDAQVATYNDVVANSSDPQLAVFLAGLPDGAEVLDLGCGPGHCAAQMRDLGFRVTATDASREMAGFAHETFGLDVQVQTFADLDAVAAFDGVWASFSLLHAPKAEMPAHLAAIHRALRPGGLLWLGLKTGTGESRDRIGRFYAYYSDTEISGLLADAGFTVTGRTTGEGTGLDGSIWPWIVLGAHA